VGEVVVQGRKGKVWVVGVLRGPQPHQVSLGEQGRLLLGRQAGRASCRTVTDEYRHGDSPRRIGSGGCGCGGGRTPNVHSLFLDGLLGLVAMVLEPDLDLNMRETYVKQMKTDIFLLFIYLFIVYFLLFFRKTHKFIKT
jgi:hypothetical protein